MSRIRGRAERFTAVVRSVPLQLVTIWIALAALLVGSYQACEARTFYRLASRPLIEFQWMWDSDSHRPIGLVLSNRGKGPAIIRDFRVWLDDEPVPAASQAELWRNVLTLMDCAEIKVPYSWFDPGTSLASEKDQLLFGSDVDGTSEQVVNTVTTFFNHAGIAVRACSVYGQCWWRCVGEVPFLFGVLRCSGT